MMRGHFKAQCIEYNIEYNDAELSGENFRSPLTWVFAPPLHRSKSDQIAQLNSAPRSSTISSRSGEIAPRSLKFKITLHA